MKNLVTKNYALGNSFFEDLFNNPFKKETDLMKTDITEDENNYVFKINLPAINKDNVKVSLNDGYMTVEASYENEDSQNEKNYICRERSYGSYSRSYYVGNNITYEDVCAKLENGVLTLNVKKNVDKPEKKYIEIA